MTLVLLGGGGHASDVLSVVEAIGQSRPGDSTPFDQIYLADDNWAHPERFEGRGEVKMVESIEAGARLGPFLVAVGYPDGRRAVHRLATAAGGTAADPIAHPAASLGWGVSLADGVVVMGQTWVSPRVRIGHQTHVGYGSTIGHDTEIGAFTSVMPGANIGGDITIGDGVLIGANATVLQGITIGDGAVVGAGAVVHRNVPAETTVVGVPARITRPA